MLSTFSVRGGVGYVKKLAQRMRSSDPPCSKAGGSFTGVGVEPPPNSASLEDLQDCCAIGQKSSAAVG